MWPVPGSTMVRTFGVAVASVLPDFAGGHHVAPALHHLKIARSA